MFLDCDIPCIMSGNVIPFTNPPIDTNSIPPSLYFLKYYIAIESRFNRDYFLIYYVKKMYISEKKGKTLATLFYKEKIRKIINIRKGFKYGISENMF